MPSGLRTVGKGNSGWILAVCVALLAGACAQEDEIVPDGLQLSLDETSVHGTFAQGGMVVKFSGSSVEAKRASLSLDIDGKDIDIALDLADLSLTEDAHGNSFEFEDRAILEALRDAVSEQYPESMETLHGRLLVKVADRFADVPIGTALLRRIAALATVLGKGDAVTSGCGGDGISCLPGTSGSSWAIFTRGGSSVCEAQSTPYGDGVCRGRCGAGCSWWDEDYTYDCLDHDVCLDYSSDCADEFMDAADDWAATFGPICFGGSSRSRPPLVPVCGNGSVDVGEQCDDHNLNSGDACDGNCTTPRCGNRIVGAGEECDDGGNAGGDGCSADCRIEVVHTPALATFGPALLVLTEVAGGDPTGILAVTIDSAAQAGGSTIALSSQSERVSVPASVTIPEGQTSVEVSVTGLDATDPVTVTASLGDASLSVQVEVVALRRVQALSPEQVTITVGALTTFTVTLDLPARGQTSVDLALDPGTFGSLPGGASVVVPDGATSATFEVLGIADGDETVTAVLADSEASASVTVYTEPEDIDIGGWTLVQTASNRTFTFPAGTMVGPGDYVIVARNVAREGFEAFWGVSLGEDVIYLNASEPANGGAEWPSINGAETFTLVVDGGATLDGPTVAVEYSNGYERLDPQGDPGDAASWSMQPSTPDNSTPGAGQSPSEGVSGLYISEFSDATGANAYPYEFVELYFDE